MDQIFAPDDQSLIMKQESSQIEDTLVVNQIGLEDENEDQQSDSDGSFDEDLQGMLGTLNEKSSESTLNQIKKKLQSHQINESFDENQYLEMEQAGELQDSLIIDKPIDDELEKTQKDESTIIQQDDELKLNPIQDFEIRQYQMSLYQSGKGKNSIVYMETGTGKTLVLVMLMWHQLCKEREKKVIFIGNTVQLVEQQARYFKNHIYKVSDLLQGEYPDMNKQERLKFVREIMTKVRIIHGQKCPDHWCQIKWQYLTEKCSAIFMTSQLFLNCLRKGLLNFNKISIIVFDECHANFFENSPYNNIMREFYFPNYQSPSKILPVIVGATASPVAKANTISQLDIQDHLKQLCANMDSLFLEIDMDDIKKYLKSAKVQFHSYQNYTLTSLYSEDQRKYMQECSRKEIITDLYEKFLCPQFMRLYNFYRVSFSDVLETESVLIKDIYKQIYEYLIRKSLVVLIEIGTYGYGLLVKQIHQKLKQIYQQKFQSLKIPNLVHSLLSLLEDLNQDFQKLKLEDSVTPKFKSLLTLLKEQIYNELFSFQKQKDIYQVLVFCTQRLIASLLSQTIDDFIREQQLDGKLKTNFIVGFTDPQRRKTNKDADDIFKFIDDEDNLVTQLENAFQQHLQTELKLTFGDKIVFKDVLELGVKAPDNQIQIIQQFRQKQLQILIATQVAEEGLDIPSSKYVIAYNFTQSSKTFIQMKGRARMDDSSFILLIPEVSNQKDKVKVQQSVQDTTKISIKVLQADKQLFMSQIKKTQEEMIKQNYYEQYIVQKTQANINTNWAYQLLHRICYSSNRLNRQNNRPQFIIYVIGKKGRSQTYIAFVIIPRIFRSYVFKGDIQNSANRAKKSVCFQACVRLHTDEYLYDDLTPKHDNNIGLHFGAGEDDENIQKSKDLTIILQTFSKKIISAQNYNNNEMKITKTYYSQQNTSMLDLKEGPFVEVGIVFKNLNSKLYCSKSMIDLLRQDNINKIFGLYFQEEITVDEKYYCEKLEAYKESIKLNLEFLDIYTDKNSKTLQSYKLKENNFAFVYSERGFLSLSQTQDICQTILKILKITIFYNRILNNQINQTSFLPLQIHLLLKKQNSILNNLKDFKYNLTIVQKQLKAQTLDETKLIILENKQSSQNNLDNNALIKQIQYSLILDHNDQVKIYIGRVIYKLAISLQILLQNPYLEQIILRQNSKYYLSQTYIKYRLIEKTNLFNYLHKSSTDPKDLLYYPGVIKNDIEFDKNQYQSSVSSLKKISSHFIHLTSEEFASFLYKTLNQIGMCKLFFIQQNYLIENNNSLIEIYKCLSLFGIFNESKGLLFRKMEDFFEHKDEIYIKYDKNNLEPFYHHIYEKIGYKFRNFGLIFQALTDVSFKQSIFDTELPDLVKDSKKSTEFIKVSKDLQSNSLFTLLDKINRYQIFDFSNDHLAFIGKYLWYSLTAQLIFNSKQYQNSQDEDHFVICHKKLIKNSTITYIACQLDLPLNINVDDIGPISNQIKLIFQLDDIYLCLKPQNVDYKINFQKGHHEGFVMISRAFHALIGSIYIDSNGNYQLLQELTHQWIYNRVKVEKFLELEFIKTEEKWRFFKWYRQNFGNPLLFDLHKVPHQDYNNHGFNRLYLPYDRSKGEIVNLKKEQLTNVSQLHIYGPTKSYAWKKVMNFIPEQIQ